NSNFAATFTAVNCTIAGNAAAAGGGIRADPGSTFNLANSIVANNTAATGPDLAGTVVSNDYNLIKNTSGVTITGTTTHNITGQAPLLGPLADNGGFTKTMALLVGSPALNAGPPSGFPATDQRGTARPFGAASDIGAFEADRNYFVVTTTADS